MNVEPLSVKVSYGDEIRRTSFNGAIAFDSLRDTIAKLFGLQPALVVLKYQDSDGDKITVVLFSLHFMNHFVYFIFSLLMMNSRVPSKVQRTVFFVCLSLSKVT